MLYLLKDLLSLILTCFCYSFTKNQWDEHRIKHPLKPFLWSCFYTAYIFNIFACYNFEKWLYFILSFHLVVPSFLGLDSKNVGWPLHMAGLMLQSWFIPVKVVLTLSPRGKQATFFEFCSLVGYMLIIFVLNQTSPHKSCKLVL